MNTIVNEKVITKKRGNKRWFVVFLLLIGGIVNYLDRASLSIAAPDMMKELELSNTDIGLLGSVFALIYALCQLPAGWLVDRFGPKKCTVGPSAYGAVPPCLPVLVAVW